MKSIKEQIIDTGQHIINETRIVLAGLACAQDKQEQAVESTVYKHEMCYLVTFDLWTTFESNSSQFTKGTK